MLANNEREIALVLAEALAEYGLTEHLAQYGEKETSEWFYEYNLKHEGFWFSGGASKICIGHSDLPNWVLKIGYTEHVSCDYAAYEYKVYCAAKEAGLEKYFPETIFLGEFCGRAFYIQERATCVESLVSHEWHSRLCQEHDLYGEEYSEDEVWDELDELDDESICMLSFGNEYLCDFLIENRVGDLHEGNFGYINGELVIVDFSGWRG